MGYVLVFYLSTLFNLRDGKISHPLVQDMVNMFKGFRNWKSSFPVFTHHLIILKTSPRFLLVPVKGDQDRLFQGTIK